MPIVAFSTSHVFDPDSGSGAMNILALLRDPANYVVRANSATEWMVELTTPEQGVVFILFSPPQGGAFIPGSGSSPPAGVVGEVHFRAADGVTDLAAMGPTAPAFFSAAQLIFETSDVFGGADKFLGSAANDVFHAGAGADTEIFGIGGDDTLFGDAGDDVLFGQAGDDLLIGGDGDDSLFGEGTPAGADAVGIDTLDGGAGRDFVSYQFVTGGVGVTVNLGAGTATGGGGTDALVSIEEVVGTAFDDTLTGAPNGYDGIAGLAGEDTMDGGEDSGDGADLISYEYDPDDVTVNLDTGEATDGWGFPDHLSNFEDANGSDHDDNITGDAGDNVLRGLAGDDVIDAGAGSDWIEGGAGDDVLAGGAGSDLLAGQDGDDRIAPGVTIGDGFDNVFAGPGLDTLDYSTSGNPVIVQMSGYATSQGDVIAQFTGVEAVVGSNFDDALIGDAFNNLFAGGAGADWLVGGGGDDAFLQSATPAGIDRLFGGTPAADGGFDTINYILAGAGVIVQLSGYASTSTGATLATFSGIEAAIGSNFDDALIGSAANNRITGAAGSDWLVGGVGDDWFVQGAEPGVDRIFGGNASADAGIDTIDYGAASAAVTVQLNGWSATAGGALLATFTGIENAIGTAFNDALIGSSANNRIAGGQGADWLVGGGGDDTFLQTIDTASVDRLFGGTPGADSGIDSIDYSGADAGVVVQLSGYATRNIGPAVITLATFSGIENAVGTAFDDALIGNGLANRLTGGEGDDWLVGGLGADTFIYQIVENTRDSIRDFTQGQDKIDLSAIDANPTTGGDDMFAFATLRHAGVVGEAVVANLGGSSLISLHLDADNIADMTIQVVHLPGTIMNAADFVL